MAWFAYLKCWSHPAQLHPHSYESYLVDTDVWKRWKGKCQWVYQWAWPFSIIIIASRVFYVRVSLDVESWFEETIGCHLLRVNLGTCLLVSKNNSKALYSMICIYGVEGSPRYRNQSFTLDLLFARWQAVMMSSHIGSHWSSEYTTRVFW